MTTERPPLTIEQISHAIPDDLRKLLPGWLVLHVAADGATAEGIRHRMTHELAGIDDAGLDAVLRAYGALGATYGLQPAHPVARRLSRAFIGELLVGGRIEGLGQLERGLASGPCLLVSNHLGYADSQLTDRLLVNAGAQGLADAMVFVAGPKVYTEPFRRMGALALSTIKTAQSNRLAHRQAELPVREVARIAHLTLARSRELMAGGTPVLIYAEGGRSRSGRLGSFLRAVSRYAKVPGAQLVPLALTGSDGVMALHDWQLRPATVTVTVGEPVPVHGEPEAALLITWQRLAELLPAQQRPAAGTPPLF